MFEEWCKICKFEKFILMGYLMGGYFVVFYVFKYFGYFNKLILVFLVGILEDFWVVNVDMFEFEIFIMVVEFI